MASVTMTHARLELLDFARGGLLLAMVVVHVVSGHGAGPEVNALHTWVGSFLISSGFVAVSGYAIGLKPAKGEARRWLFLRALDAALRLVVVMLVFGTLMSLARHGFAHLAAAEDGCVAPTPWAPPTRFDDLGILLPIAIVQLHAPLLRARGRAIDAAILLLAALWMSLPGLTEKVPETGALGVVVGILTRNTLTPFYTISSFVALGLVGGLLGRYRWASAPPASLRSTILPLAAACVLAMPALNDAWYAPTESTVGPVGARLVQLAYWAGTLALLLLGARRPANSGPGPVGSILRTLGKNSLFIFILHDALLEVNAFARLITDTPKGATACAWMVVSNFAILILAGRAVERSSGLRKALAWLLLSAAPGRRWGAQTLSWSGASFLTLVLVTYAPSAAARTPNRPLVVDDFNGAPGCSAWWHFGAVALTRSPSPEPGTHHLQVRGALSPVFAHGIGLFIHQDIGLRRAIQMDIRGYGPGSGRIKIELAEDDNQNWEIEKAPPDYAPLYDDRFSFELAVDWTGWRTITLPFSRFVDDNPGRGNDRLDPERHGTSGGLLELQLLFSAAERDAPSVNIDIDNILWTH
jgi:fucose 4-O-acetylase-like acetyltransferase